MIFFSSPAWSRSSGGSPSRLRPCSSRGCFAMLCISCRADMRVVRIEQDASMKAAGYEHRKLECVGCQRTERRLAFSGDGALWPVEIWALPVRKQPTRPGRPTK
jgi:hypothetical protein